MGDTSMEKELKIGDIGFIITKAPLESKLAEKFLEFAENALKQDMSIGFFLISDGVFIVKKNQQNPPFEMIKKLLKNNVEVIVSKDHLESAGIFESDVLME